MPKPRPSFVNKEVLPQVAAIEAKDFTVTKKLLKQAADLGLTAADVPEEYGGLELDKASSAIIAEFIAGNGSFGVAFSAHTGIGTMPLVWYGNAAQKAKYLPGIADGSIVSAPMRSANPPPARTPSTPAPRLCFQKMEPPIP